MTQESPRSLDEIMSRETAHDDVQTLNNPAAPETDEQGQPRRDDGKFAPKQQDAASGANADPDNAAQAAVEGGDGKGKVPLQAVQAERDKRKEAQIEAETLRRELAELRGKVSVLTQQRPQAQPAEKPKPKTFWESPDEFLAERTAPIRQEAVQRHFMTSRMLADDKFGVETVKEADDALGVLMQTNPNDPEVIAMQQRVQASEHPYRDLVTWHQRRKAMADIGDDPAAFRERERERIRAEILAEQANPNPAPTNQQQPAARTPLPTNFASARSEGPRTGAVYQGPKPLSEIVKGSAQ